MSYQGLSASKPGRPPRPGGTRVPAFPRYALSKTGRGYCVFLLRGEGRGDRGRGVPRPWRERSPATCVSRTIRPPCPCSAGGDSPLFTLKWSTGGAAPSIERAGRLFTSALRAGCRPPRPIAERRPIRCLPCRQAHPDYVMAELPGPGPAGLRPDFEEQRVGGLAKSIIYYYTRC